MADKTKVDKQRAEIKQETDVKERQKALDSALQKIKKNFGDGAVMRMGENKATSVEAVPSGILSLDLALGIGGFPRGRIIEMYGPESSGKSTVAMQVVAEVQKRGGTAAYIDAENAMDPVYAGRLEVNIDDLYLSQPDTGEQGLEIADALVSSGAVDILVVDSVAALVPRAEIEGEMGDSHVGLQARLMSQALRKLSGTVNKTKTIVIFINQIREKVGVMFGNPEVTPGGRALKFYASVRLEVRRGELIKDGGKDKSPLGNQVKIKVAKNKMAPPFKVAEVTNYYGRGISYVADVLDNAVDQGIAGKSGSWFDFEGEKLGQGRNNAIQTLENDPEKFGRLNTLLRDKLFNTPEEPETEPVDKQAARGKTDKTVKAPKAQATETPKKADEHYGTERLDLEAPFLTETPTENDSPGKANE
ncbi:recombinase RecA [Latilactobacillus curvatus]|uniref:recombinase RecA n=1 Tax=Latilactobacillus curvatus TaxID=28038 RepID=UPI002ADDABB9|nr:recombinase RecA [Latilactobacillus curvatus]